MNQGCLLTCLEKNSNEMRSVCSTFEIVLFFPPRMKTVVPTLTGELFCWLLLYQFTRWEPVTTASVKGEKIPLLIQIRIPWMWYRTDCFKMCFVFSDLLVIHLYAMEENARVCYASFFVLVQLLPSSFPKPHTDRLPSCSSNLLYCGDT